MSLACCYYSNKAEELVCYNNNFIFNVADIFLYVYYECFTCFGVDGEVRLAMQYAVHHPGTVAVCRVVCICCRHLHHVRTCKQTEDIHMNRYRALFKVITVIAHGSALGRLNVGFDRDSKTGLQYRHAIICVGYDGQT